MLFLSNESLKSVWFKISIQFKWTARYSSNAHLCRFTTFFDRCRRIHICSFSVKVFFQIHFFLVTWHFDVSCFSLTKASLTCLNFYQLIIPRSNYRQLIFKCVFRRSIVLVLDGLPNMKTNEHAVCSLDTFFYIRFLIPLRLLFFFSFFLATFEFFKFYIFTLVFYFEMLKI